MSDLSRRLRRAFKLDERAGPAGPAGPGGRREALRRRHERETRGRVQLPAATEMSNSRGSFYLRQLEYEPETLHGSQRLASALDFERERIANLAKDDGLALLAAEDCLFLDTETTGLAGGVGTVVFMCGMGFFSGGKLLLEQVFLRTFSEEAAALQHVAERLGEHPWLVTYVGKAYDRHRLAARMAVNKVQSEIMTPKHLDLYHLARRAWAERLLNLRLQTVEQEILGLRRPDDLPGAQAPAAFLSWIRDGSGRVDRVFEHNRLDVLSLVALLGVLGKS